MAVHPPTGPFPPNDGSNIFRRGMPKPSAKPTPPADEPTEPTEALDLDDEDALFATPTGDLSDDPDSSLSGVMLDDRPDDPSLSGILIDGPPDDQPVSAILLDDTPDDSSAEPLSAELLLDDALDDSPPARPSAADSSIFSGGLPPSAAMGSGWLDEQEATPGGTPTSGDVWSGPLPNDLPPPADPPSTAKYADAADLFADLRGDTPASDSVWLEDDSTAPDDTGRVSESEVRRVLDTTRPLFDDDDDGDPAARSSLAEIDLDGGPSDTFPASGSEDATDVGSNASDSAAGSSIFDRLEPAETELLDESDDIDFNLPVPAEASHASSVSGRLPSVDADPDAVAADLFGDPTLDAGDAGESVGIPLDGTDDRSPAIAAAVAAGALGGVGGGIAPPRGQPEPREKEGWKDGEKGRRKEKGKEKGKSSAKVPPPAKRVQPVVTTDDSDERPTRAPKKRGGLGGVLAGLATGLALGAGGFAALYLTGMIPNEKKSTVANVGVTRGGNSQAEVERLTADLNAANEKVKQTADDLKQMREGLTKRQTALDEANDQMRTMQDDLATARKEATAAKKEAVDALAMIDPLKKDAETAKKEATDAKKLAADAEGLKAELDAAKKTVTDVMKERDGFKDGLEVAKKDALEKTKTAAAAERKYAVADTKLKMTEDTLAGLVKELKANKLLDETDDVTKLPEAVKKLAAVATSGDAKKAADALLAAQKERDAARAALDKSTADLKAATAAAAKAKTDADNLVADAMKAADDKAKTAVEEATRELKKQLADATAAAQKAQDDLTAAKASGKAEAEAALKPQLDAANARVATAEKALDTKVKAMEADFAAKLADARSGVVKVVPDEMVAGEKATRSYADGMAAYRNGRYTAAEAAFAAAVQSHPADARFWYFLGLARSQSGTAGADEAFKKGAEMEGRNKPSGKMIDAALERLSFTDKQRVNKYRQ